VSDVPDPISGYTSDAGDNGDVVNPIDSDAVIHAVFDGDSESAAITETNGGAVLVNGFLPWDFQDTDDDEDGVLDMEELYINELTLMCD
jgi:hypothetical protein